MKTTRFSRRNFLKKSTLAATAITLVPRHVLGGRGYIPPSDIINLGFIGNGKQATSYFERFANLPWVHLLAGSDVDSQKLNNF